MKSSNKHPSLLRYAPAVHRTSWHAALLSPVALCCSLAVLAIQMIVINAAAESDVAAEATIKAAGKGAEHSRCTVRAVPVSEAR